MQEHFFVQLHILFLLYARNGRNEVKVRGFGMAREMKSSYSARSLCLKWPSYTGGRGGSGVSTLSGVRGVPDPALWLSKRRSAFALRPPFLFIKKDHYLRTNFGLYCTHNVSQHWASLLICGNEIDCEKFHTDKDLAHVSQEYSESTKKDLKCDVWLSNITIWGASKWGTCLDICISHKNAQTCFVLITFHTCLFQLQVNFKNMSDWYLDL